jgi:hypothetical protein
MTKNEINKFIYLLFLSKNFIRQALNDYNLNHESATKDEDHKLHYTIDYHMYSFTQLLYTIRERLKNEYPKEGEIIKKYFGSKTNNIGAINKLANALKHNSTYFTDQQNIEIVLDESNAVLSVDASRNDRTIHDEFDDRLKNKKLSSMFEEAYTELVQFCEERNYEF